MPADTHSPMPAEMFAPPERTVPTLLRRQAERFGERLLFSCGDARWSYSDLSDIVARRATILQEAGIAKGDRIALISGNSPELIEIVLACGWLGAVSVPINTASRGFQLQHILGNCAARLLIVEAEFLPALATVDLAALPIDTIWVIGDPGADTGALAGCDWRLFPSLGDEATEPAAVTPGDPFIILYTSGTTGPSKGVVCPHGQFFWWGVVTGRQLGVREGDVLMTTLPLFHTNALNCFFQALIHGATQRVERRFSVSGFFEALETHGATVTYLLGAMVPMLLSREPSAVESRHKARVALAPGVPAGLHETFLKRTGILLLDGFGTTESNAVIGSTRENLTPNWLGQVVDGFEAIVADEDDNPVPDGVPGELLLRAREPFSMASGYFDMPEKTVETWRNLWLHTGDRVVRNADGYFRFIDRMKDAIRRRGENISSYEVEQVLAAHAAVGVAAVFPVSSELAEDEVMAAIVLKEGIKVSPAEIVHFCEGKLSYFAIPRFIEFVEDLPRTENGKVQKFKLRERGRTAATWDRDAAGIVLKR
ncbi:MULTISPECIES: ATP-dependent acyl-CoA ligase [unclassified Chelatococcus]|jgi:crotonobetaine/carnitine-CoA ligase|uniref:ATP-dependent acyl-CoA ligase n=1 Tax=unclassified Chelatococcus TaxID=2638111 RepID=UPI001BCFB78B|nr:MULTISPECIES: ATP-dependent acyl-CoA ligase [unclassified Chelatococcus]CAH1648579.1 Long-chain-fatty-acid--CoA ligase [Hyphomicrobiales bacterium]MBS7741907.1 AMP-binding protein [Chelatococcus sp. HY11]MBX3541295.1 AMP-binding protein [Chelatococcus sp.]MCO5074812.1 ATP-dependent acyl-CoA ligase [Chelatococcus sp.]CAH1691195.1 Long-chain-fatty-acid--CoA ligase [Hyphomicrobiales bacterium]